MPLMTRAPGSTKTGTLKTGGRKKIFKDSERETGQLAVLYSSFTVLDTVHVKGALTLGENTADNGGVAIAYDAFKMTQQGKSSEKY